MQKEERILVIKLGALGDFVQALGAMKAIRAHHKDAHITLMTTKMFHAFGEACGYFDEIMIDQRPKKFDLKGWINLRKRLLNGKFSRIYDLQNNDRTSLYFKLFTGSKKPEWVGVAKGASHRNTSPERTSGLSLDGHKQTLSLAGVHDVLIDDLSWINEDITSFDLKEPYVLLVPGSAPQHLHKRWPKDHYSALAKSLIEKGYQTILIGTEAEKDITDFIANTNPAILNLTGKTSLFQIAALARNAHAAIGNDTGPMHVIGPTGCLCITLFSGHSIPARHAPNGENVHTIQKQNISEITLKDVMVLF